MSIFNQGSIFNEANWQWDADIIRAVQRLSNPGMDWLMYILTYLGDQQVFILVAVLIYWLGSKRSAFKLVISFIFSAFVNEGLKRIFQRVRPHDYYNDIINLNRGEATAGYAFPSGHSQNSAVLSTFLYQEYATTKKRRAWLIPISLFILLIVPFTRIYLGQHYLMDVVFGTVIRIIVCLWVSKLIDLFKEKEHWFGLALLLPIAGFVAWTLASGGDYETNSLIFTATGGLAGFVVGYFFEKQYIKCEKPANMQWWKYALRVLIGVAGVMLFMEGIRLIPGWPSEGADWLLLTMRFIRYALVGVWATLGAMSVFKALKI